MARSRNPLRYLETTSHESYDHLHKQIRSLQGQLAKLSHSASGYGRHAAHDFGSDAADLLDDAIEGARSAAREVSRQAMSAGRAIQRDPVPVMVAIGTLALISTIILRRR